MQNDVTIRNRTKLYLWFQGSVKFGTNLDKM